jgi:hypothetical protein
MPGSMSSSSSRSRYIVYGALGWVIPGLIALPFALGHESAGGESALMAVLVWWALGAIGCLVAGLIIGAGIERAGSVADAFTEGLTGVAIAWFAALAVSMAIETLVGVLHLGPVTFLLPIPFVLGYVVGFGIGYAASR